MQHTIWTYTRNMYVGAYKYNYSSSSVSAPCSYASACDYYTYWLSDWAIVGNAVILLLLLIIIITLYYVVFSSAMHW